MKWRIGILLLLAAVALTAESVTVASGDYTQAHLIAGGALALVVVLAYLWWKLMTAVMKILVKGCVLLIVAAVGLQIATRMLG